jgi:hypothetical protein
MEGMADEESTVTGRCCTREPAFRYAPKTVMTFLADPEAVAGPAGEPVCAGR